ncbi:hypothetical protein [Devosia sp. SL43]|uniref:hypothetical protein n=1 Tax=Devosia sp. SL43 TaxID=2806348 RepID=UPI001F3BB234|nr:hypothetical protein [Devosia sp. SL43]UJW85109.1 hypothetical protein IM737_17120 [Devosia sp. SL43]
MAIDPRLTKLEQLEAPEFGIECRACRRNGTVKRADMIRRFGGETTLHECARQAAAVKGCVRAATYGAVTCSVLVYEVPGWTWGKLMNARLGGWRAFLTCHRRFAALKKIDSCPETVELNILSLIAALGDDFPLARLPHRCKCPYCGTPHIDIDWHVPDAAPPLPSSESTAHLRPYNPLASKSALTVEEEEQIRTGKAQREA